MPDNGLLRFASIIWFEDRIKLFEVFELFGALVVMHAMTADKDED